MAGKKAATKAIIIDGASLWNMMRVLGARRTNFGKLYEFLVSIDKTSSLFGKPLYVLNQAGSGNEKALRSAGFEVTIAKTAGEDDSLVREKINSLTAKEVTEIVLVSADIQDFQEAAAAKTAQKITVWLVATKATDPRTKTSMLPNRFDELLEGDKRLRFVELADYKEQLMLEAWSENSPPRRVVCNDGENQKKLRLVKIYFEIPADDSIAASAIMQTFGSFVAEHPTIKGNIEIQ